MTCRFHGDYINLQIFFFLSLIPFLSFVSKCNATFHDTSHFRLKGESPIIRTRPNIKKNIKKVDARKPSQSGSENARDAKRKIKAQCIKVARWCYLNPLIMLQMIKAEKWSTKTWCCNPFIAVSEPFEAYLMTFRVNCNFLWSHS